MSTTGVPPTTSSERCSQVASRVDSTRPSGRIV